MFHKGNMLSLQDFTFKLYDVNPIQTGGGEEAALTLNVYNFFKIQPNAAKLYEFF